MSPGPNPASPAPGHDGGTRGVLGPLLRHSLNYGAVTVVHKVLAIVMLPFYTAWMLEAEFGVLFMSDVLLAVLASLWPALRAGRLEAVESMRSQ